MELQIGQTIPLFYQLNDCSAAKYVRANVTNNNNEPIPGSPVIMSPVGSLGMYANNTLSMPDSPFINAQYVVYDDAAYQIVSASESSSSQVFTLYTPNPFNPGTVPNMADAILDWFQPMTFVQLVKSVVNFKSVQTPVKTSFRGVWQPFTDRQLNMKPIGQRSWSWYWLHADPSLVLKTDDVVYYRSEQYRVMAKKDFTLFGYVEYHLILDYSGSGP